MQELLEAIARLKAAADVAEKREIALGLGEIIGGSIGHGIVPEHFNYEINVMTAAELDAWMDEITAAIAAENSRLGII